MKVELETKEGVRKMNSMYGKSIEETAAKLGHVGANARWIEGYMRLEHGCLDGLSRKQFDHEVKIGIACIAATTDHMNEQNAQSFGL